MMNMLKLKNSLKNSVSLIRWKVEGFKKSVEGVAAVEFAFLAPLMLLMYVGTIEVSGAISANRKLSRSASAVGDLITQIETCFSDETLTDIVKIADNIMKPYDDGFEILITGVEVLDDGTNEIRWSKPYGGAIALVAGDPYTLPTQIASSTGYIISSKITKAYTPAFGFASVSNNKIDFSSAAIDMEEELFLRPRVGTALDPC